MPGLSSSNKILLIRLAREAVRSRLESGDIPPVSVLEPELMQKRGCFVTLRKNGLLRGCVGTFEASRPLGENVVQMALAAAFQDSRFPPVVKNEWKDIRLEISVLGPLEKTAAWEDIQIGKHGIYVKSGARGGTYLPDVAVDQKWSREEFIINCAREKAGLSPQECAQAEIFRYEVEKILE